MRPQVEHDCTTDGFQKVIGDLLAGILFDLTDEIQVSEELAKDNANCDSGSSSTHER